MIQIVFFGVILVILLAFLYRSAKNKDGFVRYFSRGAYMRDLNKVMEDKESK